MKISVIGTGYVGIISAVGWAGLGNDVVCIDVDKAKIDKINKGIPPIYEVGLEKRLSESIKSGKLRGVSDYSSIRDSDIVLISVGTPSADDGSMDTKYIGSAAESIAKELAKTDRFITITVRSTVVPGTTERVVGKTIEDLTGKKPGKDFGLSMIPEFLKEGTALEDFDKPDRIVIGVSDHKARSVLEKLHEAVICPKLFTDIKTAEMIKYASNSFLATKVSFTNEIAGICEGMGIDVDEVMKGAGLDSRIGPKFLVAGAGFGGSCFPKDVKALIHRAKEGKARTTLLDSVMEVNMRQQTRLVDMLRGRMPLKGKRVAVLGLAFKENTDDVRESSSIPTIAALLADGAVVTAYDPQGMENMTRIYPAIQYAKGWADCLDRCDAALLITAWPEFRKGAKEYKEMLGNAPLFDARRILPADDAKKAGLEYHCIGRGR